MRLWTFLLLYVGWRVLLLYVRRFVLLFDVNRCVRLLVAVPTLVMRAICLRDPGATIPLHRHLYVPYLGRLHLLHGRHIVRIPRRDYDLRLRSWLLLLLRVAIALLHLGVLLAWWSRHVHMWMALLVMWLRISLRHLRLHLGVLRRVTLVLVAIWRLLLLLRSIRYILAVAICLLRRPVLVMPRVHSGGFLR
jgi:hypothetical protein